MAVPISTVEVSFGKRVTVTATFGADPSAVTGRLLSPDGASTTPAVAATAVAFQYAFSFTADISGTWAAGIYGSGAYVAGDQVLIHVHPDPTR